MATNAERAIPGDGAYTCHVARPGLGLPPRTRRSKPCGACAGHRNRRVSQRASAGLLQPDVTTHRESRRFDC